jgi:hypothetical protein
MVTAIATVKQGFLYLTTIHYTSKAGILILYKLPKTYVHIPDTFYTKRVFNYTTEYFIFLVISRRLNFIFWRFGTHSFIFIGGLNQEYITEIPESDL